MEMISFTAFCWEKKMKHHAILFLFICSLVMCTPIHAQQAPGKLPAPDTVTMPWNTFNELRNRAKDDVHQRSEKYAFERAVYAGTAVIEKDRYMIRFKASYVIRTFSDNGALVPIISRKLNLESLTLDGRESAWVEKKDYFNVLITSKGRHNVHGEFTIILDARKWPRNLDLPLVKIPGSEIILDVPDTDTKAAFNPGVALDTRPGRTGDRIHGYIPAVSATNIRWLKKNEAKKSVPLKMDGTIHTYVSLEEKGANCLSGVSFRILQGETNQFQVQVPDSIDILEVSTPNRENTISQWFTEKSGPGKIIHIYSSYRQNKDFKVRLSYERTETKPNYTFSVPHLYPLGVERYEHLIAVGSKNNVEINEDRVNGLERRDVRFIPGEIRGFAGKNALFYYKSLAVDFKLDFKIKSHEKAPMVTTVIENVEANSVLTETGTLMTKATYHIKNNQSQFLKLALPENAKLLNVFLSDKEVQPALDGRHLLIPISKSADASFPLEIAYLSETRAFSILGFRTIGFPESKLPIAELFWNLYTPDDFQLIYFSGNIEHKKYSLMTRFNWIMNALLSSAVHSVNAGGKGWSKSSQQYEYKKEGLRKRFKSYRQEAPGAADDFYSVSNQVQVQIPITGTRHRFESYLVKGFTPEIRFFYINDAIRNGFAFLAGIAFFLFAWWTLVLLFERHHLKPKLLSMKPYLIAVAVIVGIGGLITLFSLGIGIDILNSLFLALITFSVWQNRCYAQRHREIATGWKARVPELLLVLYLLIVMPLFISGMWGIAAFLSFLSILFHILFLKLWKSMSSFMQKRKQKLQETAAGLVVLFLFSACVFVTDAAAQNPPDLPDLEKARIHLSWEFVEKMLKKIEDKEQLKKDRIDSPFIFGTPRITGNVTRNFADLKIKIPLNILSDQYIKIPVVRSSVPVIQARMNGKALPLLWDGGRVYFEARRTSGNLDILELELMVPVREKGGVNEFKLGSPLLRGGIIELGFEDQIKSIILDGVVWQKRKGRIVRAALGRTRQLRGEFASFVRKKETADESSKRVKKIYSTTYTLVSLEEELATFYSSIRYKILNDQVREFNIRLPQDVIVHEIVGDDLENWISLGTENNTTTYRVKVLYPVTQRYDLSINYEKTIKNSGPGLTIPNLDVVGVARDVGYLGVEMQAQAEISLDEISKARIIDIQELPDIIKKDAYSPFVYAFRYVEHPYKISFNIKKHENLELDPALADRMEYTYVISPKGKVISQARMWIRNNRKQFASFTLPENMTLLSTFLDGKSVKPSIGKNKEILLPLKRQAQNAFILEVVYEDTEVALGSLFGHVNIRFPGIDIPASIVETNIFIPANMDYSEPKGDFRKIQAMTFVSWRGVTAPTEQNTYGIGTNVAPPPQRRNIMPPAPQQAIQAEQAQIMSPQAPGRTLSLKIKIPKKGKRISLNTFYVPAGASLNTTFTCYHSFFNQTGYVLSILLFMAAGFIAAGYRVFSKQVLLICLAAFILLLLVVTMTWKNIVLLVAAGAAAQYFWGLIKNRIKRESK